MIIYIYYVILYLYTYYSSYINTLITQEKKILRSSFIVIIQLQIVEYSDSYQRSCQPLYPIGPSKIFLFHPIRIEIMSELIRAYPMTVLAEFYIVVSTPSHLLAGHLWCFLNAQMNKYYR